MLLDLSAAFDIIIHDILLNGLENSVGISGSALAWFTSYLSDLHQFVAVNEEVSYRSQVQYGVGVDRYVFFRADADTDYYRSSRPITDILNRYTCLV